MAPPEGLEPAPPAREGVRFVHAVLPVRRSRPELASESIALSAVHPVKLMIAKSDCQKRPPTVLAVAPTQYGLRGLAHEGHRLSLPVARPVGSDCHESPGRRSSRTLAFEELEQRHTHGKILLIP
jgi:hypothetical protein